MPLGLQDADLVTTSWRTLDLETEVLDVDDHQGTAVVDDADEDVPWTRVHEFAHHHPERPAVPGRTLVLVGCGDLPRSAHRRTATVDQPQ